MSDPERRSARKEQAARTREEILEAAIREFSKHSFTDTTMAQLARAIRMTPGALYWHFETKEDLLLAAIGELNRRFLQEFEFLITEGRALTARQQLLGFFDRTQNFFRYHTHYGRFFGMLAALSADASERVSAVLREVLQTYATAVEGIIRYGQEKTGEFRKDLDPAAVAHNLVSSFSGMIIHQSLFKDSLSYDALASAVSKLAVEGLKPDPAQPRS